MALHLLCIDVVGLGVAQPPRFSLTTQKTIEQADIVIGAERQLALLSMVNPANQKRLCLPKLSELKALLHTTEMKGKRVVILASGDPLFYGIGRWCVSNFNEYFDQQRLVFHPAESSIQAACHRLGFSLQSVEVVSLHGRPLGKIRSKLKPNQTLAILTDKHSHPHALAKACQDAGFESSRIHVCERLGYDDEQVLSYTVTELLAADISALDPLHVTVIEVLGQGRVLPTFPGFPDTAFETGAEPGKGMISKREVRLAILSYIEPSNDDLIWDIGAGCGGVAVELAYWNEHAKVYAIEHHPERLTYLSTNRERFGVMANLTIVEGSAPQCLADLPSPNKVFIGGSDGTLDELLALAWQTLPEHGVLVASAVMATTQDKLQAFASALSETEAQIESTEIAIRRGNKIHGTMNYESKLPVQIFQYRKLRRLESPNQQRKESV